MLRLKHGLFSLLVSISFAAAQVPATRLRSVSAPQGIPPEILLQMQAQGVVPPGQNPGGASATTAPEKPSEELKLLLKLKFDRRPSTFLQAWAKPEPKPVEEDPKFDDKRKKIADLEAEIAATPVPVPTPAAPVVPPGEPVEAPAAAVPEEKPAAKPKLEESAAAEEPEASTLTLTVGVGGAGPGAPNSSGSPAATGSSAVQPATPSAPIAGGEVTEPAPQPVDPAAAAQDPAAVAAAPPPAPVHPKQAELDAAKKAYEAAIVQRKLEIFQRDVTLGRWDRVKAFLASLPPKDGPKAYAHLLKTLPMPPVPQQNRQIPANLIESNTFTFDDVLGIVRAEPPTPEPEADEAKTEEEPSPEKELELQRAVEKTRKANMQMLAVIARRALDAGHAAEELLAMLRTESAKPEGEGAFDRRAAARLLAGLSRDRDLGEFLPSAEEAGEKNDREALNLLSRFHLAWYAKDKKTVHLEDAWSVTQAALAAGDVQEVDKVEALKRAVELAPKIREELGETWLAESFTDRPQRGMEIIAAIGSQASRGFETHPTDTAFRLKGLQLQATAVEALLAKAPERAEAWRISLNLLAANWLAEAIFCYANSQATSMGPMIQRDPFGNIFYRNYRGNYRGPVWALEPAEMLKIRPGEAWVARLDDSVVPRFSTVVAELYLKVNEEVEAFPYIEALAATHKEKAKELAEEFLRVWTKNHNPNVANNQTDPYMFIYGFDQRAAGIPLTRSKQERNLAELAEWVAKLRALPIGELDQKLVMNAFTTSHSSAEVYRLDTMRKVFGSLENLDPKAIAEMAQKMRANLVGVWREPATQQQNKTRRKQKDIELEVLGGYHTARQVIEDALTKHPDEWSLHAALAALAHDEINYAQKIAKSSEFAARRSAALAGLQRAAELYASNVESISADDETVEPYQLWFYAALGACDLQAIDDQTRLDQRQPARIRAALDELPGETRERHMSKFANAMFTRMSSVNPSVKVRYLRAGFEIVGDHPQAHEARKVFEYYNDLVSEIKLEAVLDGDDVVGYDKPFGVRVNLRHTREIEREAGGFAKYLQNQNNLAYAYNYGRPLENYRDKFQDAATQALEEHFEVLAVTFNSEEVHSKATEDYGWRITPYAYLLLKARGPEVDKLPSLQIDLDFLDTSGYALIPVASAPVPLDAAAETVAARPYHDLEVTQILDERLADEGKLVLEVKAGAKGLVPDFEDIMTFAPTEFDVTSVDDQGVQLSRFDDDQRDIVSERTWMVSMTAKEDLAGHPETFQFAGLLDDSAKSVLQRYVDADLETATAEISLEERYGEPATRWPWFVGLALLLLGGLWFGFSRVGRRHRPEAGGRRLPEPITPFSVLGLLRDIERDNGFSPEGKRELAEAIDVIEKSYFGPAADDHPDLRRIAEDWVGRAG